MPRIAVRSRATTVVVREATPDDVTVIAALAPEFDVASVLARLTRSTGATAGRGPLHSVSAGPSSLTTRIGKALDASDNHVLLASLDGAPAGLLWCTIGPLGWLGADRVVHIEQFHVTRRFRRRGVGRALLQAITSVAESHGAEAVTTWTGPQDREVSRYFARLGFAPLAVRRVAPVSSLRRALAPQSELSASFPRAAEALRRTRRRAI